METTTEEKRKILEELAYHWTRADKYRIHPPTSQETFSLLPGNGVGTMSMMGSFAILPVEILHLILGELDFKSLGSMRRLNTQANGLVGTLPAYRDIAVFAPGILQDLSATGLLGKHKANHLHSMLCRDRCVGCKSFGGFIFLPTGSRCCFQCLENNPDMAMMRVSDAVERFALKPSALESIGILTAIGGDYGFKRFHASQREAHQYKGIRVVSRQEAKKLGILLWGSKEEMEMASDFGYRRDITGEEERPRRGPQRARFKVRAKVALPFTASTSFPYLDVQKQRVEKGLCCRGCEFDVVHMYRERDFWFGSDHSHKILVKKMNTFYSAEEFLVHFEGCCSAKMLWNDYILKGDDWREVYSEIINNVF